MNNVLKNKIEEVLTLINNVSLFRQKVKETFVLPAEIERLLNQYGFDFELFQQEDNPQVWLIVSMGEYKQNDFFIKYEYHLFFSKLGKFCKDHFKYKITNCDPNRAIGKHIEGVYYFPMTKIQYEFYELLKSQLEVLSLTLLTNRELEEVLLMDFIDDSMSFFNEQPNVDLLLFNDLFDLL